MSARAISRAKLRLLKIEHGLIRERIADSIQLLADLRKRAAALKRELKGFK